MASPSRISRCSSTFASSTSRIRWAAVHLQFALAQAQLRPLRVEGRQPLLIDLAKFLLLNGHALLFLLHFLKRINALLQHLETKIGGERRPVFAGHQVAMAFPNRKFPWAAIPAGP